VSAQEFVCKPLGNTSLPAEDKAALDQFNKKVVELTRAVYGLDEYRKELNKKLSYLKKAVFESTEVPNDTYNKVLEIELALNEFNRNLNGDGLKSYYEGGVPSGVKDRIDFIIYSLWSTTSAPTNTMTKSYEAAANKYDDLSSELKKIDGEVASIEKTLEKSGAPYTPGRFPEWKK
jgi:peptidoglycan hydrolase CwlO-like protein